MTLTMTKRQDRPNLGLFNMRFFAICRPELTPLLEKLQQEFNAEVRDVDNNLLQQTNDSVIGLSASWNIIFVDLEFLLAEGSENIKEIIETFLPTAAGINSYWMPFTIAKERSDFIPNLQMLMSELPEIQVSNLESIDAFYDFAVKGIRNSRGYIRKQQRHYFLIYNLSSIIDQPIRILYNGIAPLSPLIALISSFFLPEIIPKIFLILALAGIGFPISQLVQKRDPKTAYKPVYPLKGYAIFILLLNVFCLYYFRNFLSPIAVLGYILISVIIYQLWTLYSKPVEKLELCRIICSNELDYKNKVNYPGQESTDPWKQQGERLEDQSLRKLKNLSLYGFTFPSNHLNWRHTFLSHRNNDLGKKSTEIIYRSLKKRGLVIPFVDFLDIKEGSFRKEIADALYRCGTFVSILTTDTPEKLEWIERELNSAFYLFIQYGQPSIIIIEIGIKVENLNLDSKLLEMVKDKKIPVIELEDNENLDEQISRKNVVSLIENNLFRDYPILFFNQFITDFFSLLYFLLCLLFPFSLTAVIFVLFKQNNIDSWLGILTDYPFLFSIATINIFAISNYVSIPEIFHKFTASRFALDEINPPLIGVEEFFAYLVLWIIIITIFLTSFWNDNMWELAFVSMLVGIVINLLSPLFIPTIWQGRKQYYVPPKINT
jgi:hypothetical protein